MKNYKIVDVYSGYGEMDICRVSKMVGESLKSVCDKVNEEKRVEMGEEGKDYFEEFCNYVRVNESKDIGSISDGEEGFKFVFGEGCEWFKKIESKDDWNNKEWDEWMKLCNNEELF